MGDRILFPFRSRTFFTLNVIVVLSMACLGSDGNNEAIVVDYIIKLKVFNRTAVFNGCFFTGCVRSRLPPRRVLCVGQVCIFASLNE